MLIRALDAERNGVAAAQAERRQSLLGASLLHCVEERSQHTRAARPDRMSQCDRAAIDVDSLPIPAKLLAVSDRLRSESLVGFDQIIVADLGAGFLQQVSNGFDRSEEKIFRIRRAGGVAGDASEYLELMGVRVLLGDNDKGGGAIVEARCVAGRDAQIIIAAILPRERGPKLRECFERRVLARTLVGVDSGRSLLAGNLHRRDLALELTPFA